MVSCDRWRYADARNHHGIATASPNEWPGLDPKDWILAPNPSWHHGIVALMIWMSSFSSSNPISIALRASHSTERRLVFRDLQKQQEACLGLIHTHTCAYCTYYRTRVECQHPSHHHRRLNSASAKVKLIPTRVFFLAHFPIVRTDLGTV